MTPSTQGTNSLGGNLYEPHAHVASHINASTRLLDVGCGYGDFGALASARGAAMVDGIEPEAARASAAAARLRYVATEPVRPGFSDPNLSSVYDIITFFDVIEHLVDPAPVLDWAAGRLHPLGRMFLLIPNSAHWSFRRKMIKGDWSYSEWGLFDKTHVRFYDPETMTNLHKPNGLAETARRYYGGRTLTYRAAIRARPRLMALHCLLEWQRRQ